MEARRDAGARVLRLLALYVGLIAVFVVAMTAVYSLPQERIIANAAKSADLLRGEGLHPTLLIPDTAYQLDNYTDALMIDAAIIAPLRPPFEAAMMIAHGAKENAAGRVDPIEGLTETVRGNRTSPTPYAYYWHGYQTLLRPALLFLDLSGIRYLNILLLAVLTTVVLMGLRDQAGMPAAVAFGLALAITGYLIVPASIQLSNMTYLMLAATLAVLGLSRSGRLVAFRWEIFFVVGVLAAFFDLLTTPLLTLTVPLAVGLAVRVRRECASFSNQVRFAVSAAASWALGYVGSWLAKVAIAWLAVDRNILQTVARQALWRASLGAGPEGSVPVTIAETLSDNAVRLVPFISADSLGGGFWESAGPLVVVVAIVFAVGAVVFVRFRRPWAEIARAAHVLLVVPLPYLWFAVARQHSWAHAFFTYRIQLSSVFAVIFLLLSAIDFDRVRSGLLYWRRPASDSPMP